jgi:hypothetical protein
MPRKIGSHIRNNIVGYLALFVALNAGAYAAVARNSVGPKQLKTNAVRGPDALESSFSQVPSAANAANVAPNSITSDKIVDGEVMSADLAPLGNAQPVSAFGTCVGTTQWAGEPTSVPRYWKDHGGVVHLSGAVGCAGDAVEGSTMFTLPCEYMHDGNVERHAVLGGGTVLAQIAALGGLCSVVYDGPNSTTADDYVSLSGVTWRSATLP